MARHLALERSVLLTKLLVNLHFYAPGRCAPEIEDAFLNRLVHCLRVSARGPAALAAAVDNLRALAGVVLPFAAPRVGEDQELLKEIDSELLADLMNKMRVALDHIPGRVPAQQAAAAPALAPPPATVAAPAMQMQQAPVAAQAPQQQAAPAQAPGPPKQEGAQGQPLQQAQQAALEMQQKQQVLLAEMYAHHQAQQQAAAQQQAPGAAAPAAAVGVPPGSYTGAVPGAPAVEGGSGVPQP